MSIDAHVMTVRGPVRPAEIGPTSMHDHVFSDARDAWWTPESFEDPDLTDRPLEYRDVGLARWNALGIADNLLLGVEDFDEQAREVADFKRAGGSCLVDLTNVGISPAPEMLRALSEAVDIHIVAGSGFYVHPTHPPWLEHADVDAIAERIDDQLRVGLDGTDVLPGIVGEIGTSGEFHECEQRVVRAAARVASSTGTAMNVHTTATGKHAVRILDLAVAEGLDPSRLVFSHLDEVLEADYHKEVLSGGATIGFDSFGCDVYFARLWKSPSDLEKCAGLLTDLEMGYEDQLVLGHDISLKCQLKRFGGLGYDHIIKRIAPLLAGQHGVTQAVIQKLLVDNPRRLLTRAGNSDTLRPD